MPPALEADVALIHVAGGEARVTPPPGTIAQTPPRRAARGRADDLLFVTIGLHPPRATSVVLLEQLAQQAANAFYGTPGSVTAALREAAAEVNDRLVDANRSAEGAGHLQGRLLLGVLRGQDLYVCQCGAGQAILIRPGQVTRLTSEEAANRPLGLSAMPSVRYHHIEVRPGDLAILTTAPPPGWSDPTLSGLSGLGPEPAVERLAAASAGDLTGALLRVAAAGGVAADISISAAERPAPPPAREASPRPARPLAPALREITRTPQAAIPRPAGGEPRLRVPRTRRARGTPRAPRGPAPAWRQSLAALESRIEQGLATAAAFGMKILARLAPGLLEPSSPGSFPPGLLAVTAVSVPLVVATIASVVYFRAGRGELFEQYLLQAQTSVAAAQVRPSPQEAWADWEAAHNWLTLAEEYRETDETRALRQQVETALDTLNRISRLEYRPAVSGGFGSSAHISAIAASTTDLYVLDDTRLIIWHAWATGRGYEIDRDFSCLNGPASVEGMTTPVDLVSLTEPGALLTAGVVAIDEDGTIVYCAPDSPLAYSQLTPPDTGWGRIQAVDVFGDKLYVLDPEANAVWVFDAGGGLFSDNPVLYFAEQVPNLNTAIDLALAQDQLLLLFADGHVESCRRTAENEPSGGVRIRVECQQDMRFQDERPGREATLQIPEAQPSEMVYSPPPEPSLYFLDTLSDRIFVYSMRLVYQGQLQPAQAFESIPTALTVGPPNDLFLAVGDQVYYAQPGR